MHACMHAWSYTKYKKKNAHLPVVRHQRLADHGAQQDHLLEDLERRADDAGLARVEGGLHGQDQLFVLLIVRPVFFRPTVCWSTRSSAAMRQAKSGYCPVIIQLLCVMRLLCGYCTVIVRRVSCSLCRTSCVMRSSRAMQCLFVGKSNPGGGGGWGGWTVLSVRR